MGKRYKTILRLKEEDNQTFTTLSNTYRNVYNTAIEIQFSYLSYQHRLLSEEELLDKIFEKKKSLQIEKIDKGIVLKASLEALRYFNEWWNKRCSTPAMDMSVHYTPKHLSPKQGSFFKTSSILKISSKGYLYIPKVGERRLKRLHSIPSGSYKNIKVEFDGKRWIVSLESTIDVQPITNFLRDKLEVQIGDSGTIFIEEVAFDNVTESEPYIDLSFKLNQAKDNYLGATDNKQKNNWENRIKFLKSKINNLKASYYSRIIKQIIASKPRNLIISAEAIQDLYSSYHKRAGTPFFITYLKRRAEEVGIQVEVLGTTFEI